MKTKKIVSFILTLVLTLACFTACFEPDGASNVPNEPDASNENNGENQDGSTEKSYSKDFLEKFGYNHENTAFAKVKILEIYDMHFLLSSFVIKIEIEEDYFGGLNKGDVYHIAITPISNVGDISDPSLTFSAINMISEYDNIYLYFNYEDIISNRTLHYQYTRDEYYNGNENEDVSREMNFENFINDDPSIKYLQVLPIKDGIVDMDVLQIYYTDSKVKEDFTETFVNKSEAEIKESAKAIYDLTAPNAKKALNQDFYDKYGYNQEGDMFVWAQLAKFLPGIYEGHKIVAHICIYGDSYNALSHKLGNYYISIDIGDYGTEAEKNSRASSVKALFAEHTEVFISVPNATEVLTDDLSAFPENDDNILGFFDAAITLDSYRIISASFNESESFYNQLAEIFGSNFEKYDIYFEQYFVDTTRTDVRTLISKLYARGRRNVEAKEQGN